MDDSAHLRRAFAFRAAYLALAWGLCLAFADPSAEGAFVAVVMILAWALPIAAPIILWLDWRWLQAHPDAVNRFGFRRRR